MPIESLLRPILETVLDAVVAMDRDGVIRAWNRHAVTTFGWTAEEAIGKNLGDLIVPPALRSAHHAGLARFNLTGEARVLDHLLELTAVRRDGSEIPVELSITMVSREGRDAFVGFVRDISERRRTESQIAFQLRESRLMFELSELAAGDLDFESALAAALDAICELTEWPVGHAFLVDEDTGVLRSGPWSGGAMAEAGALVAATEVIEFRSGVGLPGRVLAAGKAIWMSRADDEDNFPRRGLGFESGFAFPVLSEGRCIAVLEFFSHDPREPDASLLMSARAIGAQIGRVFERKRAEELRALLLAELDHRAKNILSVVRGIAQLSFRDAASIDEAQRVFDTRIDAVAQANAVLRGDSGNAAPVGDIVRKALAGCGAGESRVQVDGPPLCVESSAAIMLALAVHELCTNAFKYGALSADPGNIAVRWSICESDPGRFDFEWVERHGPEVREPGRTGFGMRILGRGMESATGGKAEIDYAPDGFRYRLVGARHQGEPGQRSRAA